MGEDAGALAVVIVATLTAVATGLGAIPFLLARHPRRSWLGVANALAAGFMVGASAGLLWEGARFGSWQTIVGGACGVLFIALTRRLLGHTHPVHFGSFGSADSRRMLLIVGVMTVHSFTEGVGIGVSFGGGETFGFVIALAIAVHNIPEGLAISLVLIPRGVSVRTAAAWSVFSSLPQPLMALPAFLFVEAFEPLLPIGLGFAAGAMLWMVAMELVPEAMDEVSARVVALVALPCALAMLALQAALL